MAETPEKDSLQNCTDAGDDREEDEEEDTESPSQVREHACRRRSGHALLVSAEETRERLELLIDV